MANFRIYNIQLLPNSSGISEIGVSGYKAIFSKFRHQTERARIEKRLLQFHRDIGRDAHFGPQEFHSRSGYVWGKFVKYKRTDKVDDLNTMKPIFKEGHKQVGVAGVHEMLFVFDCRQHFFAIEEAGGALPNADTFKEFLQDYLQPICKKLYPSHSLHILLIADKNSLETVLENAIGFSHIEVRVTFPNGDAENSLEQLKRSKIQDILVKSSPGGDGLIAAELPPFLLGLMKGAIKFGRTKISYLRRSDSLKSKPERESYDSACNPMHFEKRKTNGETEEEFSRRCIEELRPLIAEISPSETTLGKNS